MKKISVLIIAVILAFCGSALAAITLTGANWAFSVLALPVYSTSTTLTVQAGDGVKFPQSENFRATLFSGSSPSSAAQREVLTLSFTNSSTPDTFNIVARGQEGTTAAAIWNAGTPVWLTITEGRLDEIDNEIKGIENACAPGTVYNGIGPGGMPSCVNGTGISNTVNTFIGRSGAVVAQSGDYNAVQVGLGNVPDSNPFDGSTVFTDIKTEGPWLDVRAFGAVGDGVHDDTAALQAAIYNGIVYQKKVLLPAGTYKITSPLLGFLFSNGAFTQLYSLDIEGSKMSTNDNTASGTNPPSGAGTNWQMGAKIAPTFTNSPALIIQDGRSVRIKDITIIGQNNYSLNDVQIMGNSNYVVNGCRDSQYSPYAGIAIDPFYTSVPADGGYPGMSQYYVSTAAGSSNVELDNVQVEDFVAGISLETGGNFGNSSEIALRNCFIYNNKVGLAITEPQSRNVFIYGGQILHSLYGIDGLLYGPQQGVLPHIYGLNMMDGKYLFDVYGAYDEADEINGLHAEGFASLGFFGNGNDYNPVTFHGCELYFFNPSDMPEADFQLYATGPIEFDGCQIEENAPGNLTMPLRFYTSGAGITFRNCSFEGNQKLSGALDELALAMWDSSDGRAYTGTNWYFYNDYILDESGRTLVGDYIFGQKYLIHGDAYLNGATVPLGATIQMQDGTGNVYHVASDFEYNVVLGTITLSTSSPRNGSFTVTNASNFIRTGDLVYLPDTGVSFDGPAGTSKTVSDIAIGIVNTVSGDTVTINGIPQDLPAGTYNNAWLAWWPRYHQATTGTTTSGSNIINSVSAPTAWAVNDRIQGAGIPAGSFINGIVGTQFTISQAATASAASVRLYDADVSTFSGTPR